MTVTSAKMLSRCISCRFYTIEL